MGVTNTVYGYGSVAKGFHWVIFLLIAGLLAVGFIMTSMQPSPDMFKLYSLHKSTGLLVLMLAGIRLLWKMVNVAPILPSSILKVERFLAHMGHLALYGLMIAMPLSGWLMSSAAGFTVSVYGLFTMPNLIEPSAELKAFFVSAHEVIAWMIIVMVSLHAGAALLHHFYYRNNVLRRMLPFVKEGTGYEPHVVDDTDTLTGC